MSVPYQPVRKTVAQIVDKSVKPLARHAGFTKSGFNFHRRLGETVQVINIQLSRYNFANQGAFFVNIGIAFDKLCALEGRSIDEKPREWKCHFRRRVADYCSNMPDQWKISAETDIDEVAIKLSDCIRKVIDNLNDVASVETFLATHQLGKGADEFLLAQLAYVEGDFKTARQAVERAADFFKDRRGSTVSDIIKRLHLEQLETEHNE